MMRFVAVLFALAAAWAPPLHARSIVIQTFDAEVVVDPSGAILVTETLGVRFTGAWNGIFRDISLQHRTASDRSALLRMEVISVTDGAGAPLEWWDEGSRRTQRLRIRVPGAADAERTVVIRYRVANAIRYYRYGDGTDPRENFDELYWNVTGHDWEVPIEAARVRVHLPAGVEPTGFHTYTGPPGASGTTAAAAVEKGVFTAGTSEVTLPGDGFTVGVRWPIGHVAVVEYTDRAAGALLWAPWAAPLLALLFGYRRWNRYGRDPKRRALTVRYEPPNGLTPTELGTLVDHQAEMHDVTAALVDLAVRGHLTIEERSQSRLLGLVSSTEYVFHLRTRPDAWAALEPHERLFLQALSTRGEPVAAPAVAGGGVDAGEPDPGDGAWMSVPLSKLTNSFYKDFPGIRNAVYDRLLQRGFYDRRPDTVVQRWAGSGVAIIIGSVFAGFMMADWGAAVAFTIFGAGAAAGVVFIVFGSLMPARTESGARAMEEALGFKEFLEKVETPRYRKMITSPELFERYLPHAMAFQVESRWARAFAGLYREPPDWYRGSPGTAFTTGALATSMRSVTSAAGTAMTSSPSSSSGSGGGGSSGGGSGGGGGGGW